VAFSKEGEAIGCAALRPLPLASSSSTLVQAPGKEEKVEKVCEMKRLYCVPESRGIGLGRALVDVVIAEAERLGYEEMRLDTLPTMEGARRLYEGLGFVETERYYETPIEGTLFLAKSLGGDQGEGGV
jgi:ribosomal protein S18 acetylase RimI-like enzyme